MTLSFTVPGEPVPQPRARVTTRGGFGRAYTPSSHPIHAYRQAIAAAARQAGAKPTDREPLTLVIEFIFTRPKSHLTRQGEVRSNAPRLPRPDASNGLKGVEDSLNGVAYHDDSQIGLLVVAKRYGREACTRVWLW